MQKNFRLLSVLTLTLFTTFIACKKDSSQQTDQTGTEQTAHAEDQSRVSSEMDAVDLDVNYSLENNSTFTGRMEGDSICAATVVYDTLNSTKKITITYNGTDCGGLKTRTGTVMITMASGIHWKDAGAQVNVTYQNFKVVRKTDNKSITLNGTYTFTNVGGGLLRDLAQGRASIVHTVTSSGLSITFDDGTQRTWQVARQRTYTLANGGTITITGIHTEGTQSNIAEWGTDRFGHPFTTAITQPLIISANCQFRLVSGQVTHTRVNATAVATFGLDVNGNAVSCPSGSYYFKLVWTGSTGKTLTFIAPY
ncbi:MAG: hypothetical protein ACXVMS_03645 [Flavisolibacter sp.]